MDKYREEWGCWWKQYVNYLSTLPSPTYQPQILFRVPVNFPSNFTSSVSPASNTVIGYKYKMASIKRRIAAEIIDFQILMFVKYILFTMLGAEQQAFVKAFLLDEDLESEISMDELIDFLSYLFLYWAIVLIYESVLLSYSRDGKGGATIGKRLMGIKVVKGTSVSHIPTTNTVIVKPGTDIGFWRAVSRTAFKDLTTTVFFPVFFTMLHSRSGQSFYDITTGTIVVQKEGEPVYENS
ncbi:hypothetical protein ACHWQZ_G005201 [Mnemiopsis leidyi]